MKIELYKDEELIGYLRILGDSQGGGLNGGVFFEDKGGHCLYRNIPLFEKYKLTDN